MWWVQVELLGIVVLQIKSRRGKGAGRRVVHVLVFKLEMVAIHAPTLKIFHSTLSLVSSYYRCRIKGNSNFIHNSPYYKQFFCRTLY